MGVSARGREYYYPAVAVLPASGEPSVGARGGRLSRVAVPPWLIVTGGLLAAVVAGMAVVYDLPLGIAFVGACVFLPLVLLSLPMALAVWIPVAWNEFSHVPGKAPLAGALLLFVAWIGTRKTRGTIVAAEHSVRVAQVAFVLLLVWVTLSISWASDRSHAWSEVIDWYFAGGVFLLVTTVASIPAHVRLVALAFVVGALASIVIGLTGSGLSTTADAIDLATRQRFSGGAGDPNYLAAGLVAALALAAGLVAVTRDSLARLGLAATVLALVAALAATESRGGLIAALIAFLAAVALARERRATTVALGIFVTAAATIFLLLSPSGWERMTTFDAGGTGRTELWQVAIRMAGDHPIVGVGIRGYEHESGNYVLQAGNLKFVERIAEQPVVTHNVYLQQLAETGIVGLALLLVLFGACLVASQSAARRYEAGGDRAMAALARATTVAMIGMLAASFFISNSTDKRLWIVLALGPALLLAARPQPHAPAQPRPASTER
jgi:O-antigen ligase